MSIKFPRRGVLRVSRTLLSLQSKYCAIGNILLIAMRCMIILQQNRHNDRHCILERLGVFWIFTFNRNIF